MRVEDLSISGTNPLGARGTLRRPVAIAPGGEAGVGGERGFSENRKRRSPGAPASSVAPRRERRVACRYEHPAFLTISVFNQGAVFEARLINYSQDGLCAETGHAIRPGTSIYVRMDKDQAGAQRKPLHPGFRTVALGEARWGRVVGHGQPTRYRIGIRYYPPHY